MKKKDASSREDVPSKRIKWLNAFLDDDGAIAVKPVGLSVDNFILPMLLGFLIILKDKVLWKGSMEI